MTYSSRRSFMVGGLVVVAGAGVAGCSGGGSSSATGGTPTPTAAATPSGPILTAAEVSDWDKLVGSSFIISGELGKVSATLASLERITDATRPADLARHQPFFATFDMGQSTALVGGKTYSFSHATKGSFDLFLGLTSQVQGKSLVTATLN
ncbi:hypothetical protein [Sphingomonas sp. KR3-1]|uniref:DUF6916 family protein n=1 Tax=Sphingomonas sp. KR3-1 TaxID=3156611 RepID=UPI0032B59164